MQTYQSLGRRIGTGSIFAFEYFVRQHTEAFARYATHLHNSRNRNTINAFHKHHASVQGSGVADVRKRLTTQLIKHWLTKRKECVIILICAVYMRNVHYIRSIGC